MSSTIVTLTETTMRELTPREVAAQGAGFRLLDVREPWEFEGPLGHIAESALLPLGQVEISGAAWLAADPEGGIPLVVCRSGRRSAEACRMLEGLGASDVVNLAGGLIAWHQAALPIERTEPASTEALLEEIVAWLAQVRAMTREAARASLEPVLASRDRADAALDRDTLGRVIDSVARRLADEPPADRDLCLAAFRRSLEML